MEVVDTTDDADCNTDYMIEVSGFGTKLSAEQLEMYFESPKAGSKQDAVKHCTIVSEGNCHVTFHDRQGIYNVLMNHTIKPFTWWNCRRLFSFFFYSC